MLNIGHRGCRGLYPENTILSFLKTIELGAHAIELDVVISKDNQIVVSHEPFMSSVTCLKPNGKEITSIEDKMYNLFEMNYTEILEFDCGLKYHPKFPSQQKVALQKPLLSSVINECEAFVKLTNKPFITYIIEIKSKAGWVNQFYPTPEKYVEVLLQILQKFDLTERLILKSFDVNISNEIKKQAPQLIQSLLVNIKEKITNKLQLLNFKPEIIGPNYKMLSREMVKSYQKKDYLIYPWTINEISDIKRFISYGVDGIITDYPNRLRLLI